jgi:hypothetical protein
VQRIFRSRQNGEQIFRRGNVALGQNSYVSIN